MVGANIKLSYSSETRELLKYIHSMLQLTFDFSAERAPTFANFLAGQNAHALELLKGGSLNGATSTFIWGSSGVGKTHLLMAIQAQQSDCVFFVAGQSLPLPITSPLSLVLIDDAHALSAVEQAWLFNVYNSFYLPNKHWFAGIVIAARCMPRDANIREDLATRITSGLTFNLISLTDEEKPLALERHAESRGFKLSSEVIHFLLTRFRRDMPALMAVLDRLDQYSLTTKRLITVPLVREAVERTDAI